MIGGNLLLVTYKILVIGLIFCIDKLMKVYCTNVWINRKHKWQWVRFMKILVVHINQL